MMLAGFLFLLLITGGSDAFNDTQNDEDGRVAFNDIQNDEDGNIAFNDTENDEDGGVAFNNPQNQRLLQRRRHHGKDDAFFNHVRNLRLQQRQQNRYYDSDSCTYRDVLKHLNLTKTNDISMLPPDNDNDAMKIRLGVILRSILDMNEKDQLFVSSILVDLRWYDKDLTWDLYDFCYIWRINPPTTAVWKPDITIAEMIEKDKSQPSPYLVLDYDGEVRYRENMVVVTTCKMEVYKFPFDFQKCNLSFQSTIFSEYQIKLVPVANDSWDIDWSRSRMLQLEWLFVNMTSEELIVDNFFNYQSVVAYTITMKRRSALYIANFLVPVLFFLCLDLASFLISEGSGEKLGFKVTVLLAITVMQLILNEILPSSSDRIPLIAIYCIGIFGLMMISLVETMFVMYLMEKDNDEENHTTASRCCGGPKTQICCVCVSDVTVGETPEEPTVEQKDNSSQQTEENVSNEPTVMLSSKKEEGKAGYWTRVAKIFNRVFFICYVITAITFLGVLFIKWLEKDE